MVIAWLASAWAASVQCDPEAATRLLEAARIAPRRAPVSHPELIPGLALASPTTPPELREALTRLCVGGSTLSLVPAERWEQADWAAWSWVLSRTERVGCTLAQEGVVISVALSRDDEPRFTLRNHLPVAQTPVGDCAEPAIWREERVIAGVDGPVRVVLSTEQEEGRVLSSALLARRADRHGWTEQTLMSPAPARWLGGWDGPDLALADHPEDPWIVAYGHRQGAPPACVGGAEQTVWRWEDRWVAAQGRAATALLAQRGAWRLASDDGWFLVLAVLDEAEYPEILAQRLAWLQQRWAEPLHLFPSSAFPGLNPGFWIIAPAPWPTRVEAVEARRRWSAWRRSYVKRGWVAADPCVEDQAGLGRDPKVGGAAGGRG